VIVVYVRVAFLPVSLLNLQECLLARGYGSTGAGACIADMYLFRAPRRHRVWWLLVGHGHTQRCLVLLDGQHPTRTSQVGQGAWPRLVRNSGSLDHLDEACADGVCPVSFVWPFL
jgi:hypothetical protein